MLLKIAFLQLEAGPTWSADQPLVLLSRVMRQQQAIVMLRDRLLWETVG